MQISGALEARVCRNPLLAILILADRGTPAYSVRGHRLLWYPASERERGDFFTTGNLLG